LTKPDKHKSALHENEGVSQSEMTDVNAISKIQDKRKTQPAVKDLIAGIINGNITALSRAITIIESGNPNHLPQATEIIKACLSVNSKSIRITSGLSFLTFFIASSALS
jgi:LAO/AO transport system kinase